MEVRYGKFYCISLNRLSNESSELDSSRTECDDFGWGRPRVVGGRPAGIEVFSVSVRTRTMSVHWLAFSRCGHYYYYYYYIRPGRAQLCEGRPLGRRTLDDIIIIIISSCNDPLPWRVYVLVWWLCLFEQIFRKLIHLGGPKCSVYMIIIMYVYGTDVYIVYGFISDD